MATTTEYLPPPQPPITKRNFLKISALAAAGGVIAALTPHEVQVASEGYFTVDGVRYFPLYEKHSLGPQTEIPDDTDGVFLERIVNVNSVKYIQKGDQLIRIEEPKTHFDAPAEGLMQIIQSRSVGLNNLFSKVRHLRIPVGLGDAAPKNAQEDPLLAAIETLDEKSTDRQKFYGGLIAAIAGQVPPLIQKIILSKIEPPKDAGWPRRTALINLGKAAVNVGGNLASALGLWLASGTDVFKEPLLMDLPNSPLNTKEAILGRFLIRLNGLISHTHPEDPLVFTRNLLLALKIKNMGEVLKQHKEFPILAYDIGRLHGGIEDYISLPADILRTMIVYVNKEYVRKSIDAFGLENYCSLRMIKVNQSGEFNDMDFVLDDKLMKLLQ